MLSGTMPAMIEILFPRRLHRLGYLFRGLVADGVTYFLYSCSTTMNSKLWWACVIALLVYGMFFIILPRIRDIGMSGWWLLAILIPVVNVVFGIILLFRAPALLGDRPNQPLGATAAPAVVPELPRQQMKAPTHKFGVIKSPCSKPVS